MATNSQQKQQRSKHRSSISSKRESNNEFLRTVYAQQPQTGSKEKVSFVYSTPGAFGVSTKLTKDFQVSLHRDSTASNEQRKTTSNYDQKIDKSAILNSRESRNQTFYGFPNRNQGNLSIVETNLGQSSASELKNPMISQTSHPNQEQFNTSFDIPTHSNKDSKEPPSHIYSNSHVLETSCPMIEAASKRKPSNPIYGNPARERSQESSRIHKKIRVATQQHRAPSSPIINTNGFRSNALIIPKEHKQTLLKDLHNIESCEILDSQTDFRKSIKNFCPVQLLPELACEVRLTPISHTNSQSRLQKEFRNSLSSINQIKNLQSVSRVEYEEIPQKIQKNVLSPMVKRPLPSQSQENRVGSPTQNSKSFKLKPLVQMTKVVENVGLEDFSSPVKKMNQTLTNWENPYGYNQINCQSQQAEPFIRRAVQKIGWQEVAQTAQSKPNSGFHIRFNISDLEGQASDLQPRHFYNHHPQNRELTTKAGLCKNLWQHSFDEYEYGIQDFFPRCYDLADGKQCADFQKDFYRTACLSVVKMVAKHFTTKFQFVNAMYDEYVEKVALYNNPVVFKQNFKARCKQLDLQYKLQGQKVFGGNDQLRNVYYFAKGYLEQQVLQDEVNRKQKRRKWKVPQLDEHFKQISDLHKLLILKGVSTTITSFEMFKFVKLNQKLLKSFPQLAKIDGFYNLWIVKPSYNARGVGIYCSRDIQEILPDLKKPQQKVVQKYIENPLLLQQKPYIKRKFDFRQWVLVLGWEPLDVLFFDSCYLKICGSDFDLKNHEDILRHLSNYSLQQKKGAKELVMSSQEFEQYFQGQYKKPEFTWEKDMLPKLQQVVWKSLKALQDTQENRPNTFEIYGFDIVLDQQMEPWVIEINLSPACAERAGWLTKMLDDSALDLLAWLEKKILVTNAADTFSKEIREKIKPAKKALKEVKGGKYLNPESFYEENEIQYRWVRLPESIEEIKLHSQMMAQQQLNPPDLAIQAVKANPRVEKKIDRQYQTEVSTLVIQSLYRGYLARKEARNIRRYNASIIIQKYTRMFLAKLELTRLKREKASIRLQKWTRMIQAKQQLQKLKEEDILKRKVEIITKLQSFKRRKQATIKVDLIRKTKAATILQKQMRGYRSRLQTLKERTLKTKILKIQKFYKRRFKQKKRSVILVQKYLKGYLKYKKRVREVRQMRAFSLAQKCAIQQRQKKGFLAFNINRAAVQIQKQLRRIFVQKQLILLRKLKAYKSLQFIAKKYKARQIRLVLNHLKLEWVKRVVFVQKYLRSYKAKKKTEKLYDQRQTDKANLLLLKQKNQSALLLQRYLRSHLSKKKVEWMRIQEGAATLIQSLFRSYRQRKKYLKFLQRQHFALKQKEAVERLSNLNKTHTPTPLQKRTPRTENSLRKIIHRPKILGENSQQLLSDYQSVAKKESIKQAQALIEQMQSKTGDIWSKFQQKKKEIDRKFTEKSSSRQASRQRSSIDHEQLLGVSQKNTILNSDRQQQIQNWYTQATPSNQAANSELEQRKRVTELVESAQTYMNQSKKQHEPKFATKYVIKQQKVQTTTELTFKEGSSSHEVQEEKTPSLPPVSSQSNNTPQIAKPKLIVQPQIKESSTYGDKLKEKLKPSSNHTSHEILPNLEKSESKQQQSQQKQQQKDKLASYLIGLGQQTPQQKYTKKTESSSNKAVKVKLKQPKVMEILPLTTAERAQQAAQAYGIGKYKERIS